MKNEIFNFMKVKKLLFLIKFSYFWHPYALPLGYLLAKHLFFLTLLLSIFGGQNYIT